MRVALATSIALFAFTMSFGIGPAWIHYPAAGVALLQLWTGAGVPTRRALEDLQRDARTRGFTVSVVAALRAADAECE